MTAARPEVAAPAFRTVRVVSGPMDRERFEREILPSEQPVVMRGLVADWPAVAAGKTSFEAAAGYFKARDKGQKTSVSLIEPEQKGRFFYTPDMSGFNFKVDQATPSYVLDWLLSHIEDGNAPTVYVQSLMLSEHMPAFEAENPMPLLTSHAGARLWIGNEVRTQTHFDPSYNIACVVAGQRRFTLFPPEQIVNLYPGPFDTSPGNVPVSMPGIEEPDFVTYPRLAQALEAAQVAELEPGDAIFVPYAWWHHVQSYGPFNLLVNYWWNGLHPTTPSPFGSLYLALLTIRDLPPAARAVWRRIFELYVFSDDSAAMAAHLPEAARGAFGPPVNAVVNRIRAYLKRTFGL